VTWEHSWAAPFLRVQCAWNGTCLFPTLPVEECDVKAHVYDPVTCMSYGQSKEGPDGPDLLPPYAIHKLTLARRNEVQPRIAK